MKALVALVAISAMHDLCVAEVRFLACSSFARHQSRKLMMYTDANQQQRGRCLFQQNVFNPNVCCLSCAVHHIHSGASFIPLYELHSSGCAAGNLGPQQQKHSQLSNGHGDFPTAMASLQHLWLFVV
jgi:hypothetical protein